ncbi:MULTISPECIES: hypothetical protein [Anaerotignum]|uniref:hypothetical protein n=1 Tax=Anaerotignum TaxID=2039240 RepID=UPI002108D5EB|nr:MULTISPECIES: hypothetical protein [Anaerotignum]MCQ4935179.1 hypothetical protein [Anaerotignum propionicum]
MNEKQKEIMQIIQSQCINGREMDVPDILKYSSSLTMKEVLEAIPFLENQGFIEVIEIDMCCGADYIVTGITNEGLEVLNS